MPAGNHSRMILMLAQTEVNDCHMLNMNSVFCWVDFAQDFREGGVALLGTGLLVK